MLEQELRELRVDWPPTPDIAGSLVLEPAPPARRWTSFFARPAWQLAIAIVALIVAVVMAVPSTRAAVLDFLGLSSVRIEHREPRVSRFGSNLALGDPVTLERAQRRAGFPVLVPAAVGRPDAVYLYENPSFGKRVDLVYRARRGLPRASTTGAGLLVTEMQATVTPAIQKTIGSGTHFERLFVGGDRAYFFSGREHGFAYVPKNGVMAFEDQRLAGNTLLVERSDGVLLRIEGRLSRDEAVRIASSAR
jgi:hypothetical protein